MQWGDGGRWKSVLGGRRCKMKANEATWWEEMERVMTHLKWRVNERKWQNHEGKQKHLKTGGILKITTRGECSKMEWKRRGNLQTHTHSSCLHPESVQTHKSPLKPAALWLSSLQLYPLSIFQIPWWSYYHNRLWAEAQQEHTHS